MNEVIQREPSTDVVITTVAGQVAPTHYSASPEYNEMVLSLLRQSARSGNADSMAKLGAMYACGDGVPKNYSVAFALLRRAAESPDPIVAGSALTSLAEFRKAAGDAASAAALLRRALEKADAVEKDGPTVALILNLLAQVAPQKEAIAMLQRALSIDERKLGRENAQTLQDVRRLAILLRAGGQAAEAAKLERQFRISH